ncbi:MAG: helix-turn-helix transcriptional regulator [Gemmatimonadaceae bacterium]|nr:helix-turn-helix transcriptional regulator [Gemmatimonadaceae bacterium]
MARKIRHPREHDALCAQLLKLRKEYAFTQEDIADALNLSRPQYNALETGRSMLSFDHLCGLAHCFKIRLTDLVNV